MTKTIPPTVLYIDRDRISLCTPTTTQPAVFKFTRSMIADLEIVNPAELHLGLRQFIEQNKIKPGQLVLIISKFVYFEKNYPGPNPPLPEEMDTYVETVPFSAVSSKLFKVISGYKQVVLNRSFYEIFKQTFEELGFTVMAVVPGFALGQNPSENFTAETCRVIYKKMDQIIVDSIIGASDTKSFSQQEQAILEKNKPTVVILIFLVFIACAAAVYFFVLRPPAPRRVMPTIIRKVLPTPLPSPTPPHTATPSAELLKSLSVQILNSSGIVGAGSSLSAQLRSVGFYNIIVANSGKIISGNRIETSPLVSTTSAEFITKFIQDRYPGAVINTNLQARYDLVIDLGKTTP